MQSFFLIKLGGALRASEARASEARASGASEAAILKKYYEYASQVNHIEGHPENCCLDHLELGSAEDNKDAFAVDAPQLLYTVFKRPALKRPAAAK